MRVFRQLILLYQSGGEDFRYSYKLEIDQLGHTFWEGTGAVDTKSKAWRLFEGYLNDFDPWVADLQGRPSDADEIVLDAPRMCLTVTFHDGTVFTGIHYFLNAPPDWMVLVESVAEAAEVDELVRPSWKRLADGARMLCRGDRERLIRRLEQQRSNYESLPGFLRRNGE